MVAEATRTETRSWVPQHRARRRRGPAGWLLANAVPPLVVLVAWFGFFKWRSGLSLHQLFLPPSWEGYDGYWYLYIARHGYTAIWHCSGSALPPHLPPGNYLCGSVGWFPGLGMVTRLVSWLPGVSIPVAGLIVAWACFYGLLFVMWRLLADSVSLPTRWACLMAAAVVPGSMYFAAVFPIAMCAGAMLGALYFSLRSAARFAPAFALLCAAWAGYSYITGIVMLPALAITGIVALNGRRRIAALCGALGSALGFGAVLLHQQLAVGIWDGYFIATRKFGVGAHNPLTSLLNHLRPAFHFGGATPAALHIEATQTLLTLLIVLGAAVLTIYSFARNSRLQLAAATTYGAELVPTATTRVAVTSGSRYWLGGFSRWIADRIDAFELCFLMATIGVWLVPYIAGGQESVYRPEAFIVLAIPLFRKLPWPLLVPLILVELWVASHMFPLFVDAILI